MTDRVKEQLEAYKNLRNNGQAFFVNSYEDADNIIEALEKQIPKKPKQFKENTDYYICPSCGTLLVHECGCHNNDCNQKIDWSEVE